jgi:hypothetical protein
MKKTKTKARIKARLASRTTAPQQQPSTTQAEEPLTTPDNNPTVAPHRAVPRFDIPPVLPPDKPIDLLNVLSPVPWDETKERIPEIVQQFISSAPDTSPFDGGYEFEHEFLEVVGEVAECFKRSRNGAAESAVDTLGNCASYLVRMIRSGVMRSASSESSSRTISLPITSAPWLRLGSAVRTNASRPGQRYAIGIAITRQTS